MRSRIFSCSSSVRPSPRSSFCLASSLSSRFSILASALFSAVWLQIAPPTLPDLTGYTAQAVQQKIQRGHKGKVTVRRMLQEDALKEFIGGDNKMAEWVVRQHGIPQAIFVDDGHVDLAGSASDAKASAMRALSRSSPSSISPSSPLCGLERYNLGTLP